MYEIKTIELTCKLCNKEFKNQRGLSQHIYQQHSITAKVYYDTYYKQNDEGLCLNCGKQTQFLNMTNGYRLYCCRKCTDTDVKKQNKTRQTFIDKYGVDSIFKIPEVHNKGVEKAQSSEVVHKRNTTNMQRYNSINPFGSNKVIKKISSTKTKNGHRSNIELYFENLLKQHNINYESEHFDTLYPYNCDFYLPDYKMYVEIHSHWTHNTHFFDSNNQDDIQQLAILKEKAKTSSYYRRAIEIWTETDIEKRNVALKNKLNYVVLWNKDDIDTFINIL